MTNILEKLDKLMPSKIIGESEYEKGYRVGKRDAIEEVKAIIVADGETKGATGLKTKYQYLQFIKKENHLLGKWVVINHKYKQTLGEVEYNYRWKTWEFYPEEGTGYDVTCLIDMIDFLKQLNSLKKGNHNG